MQSIISLFSLVILVVLSTNTIAQSDSESSRNAYRFTIYTAHSWSKIERGNNTQEILSLFQVEPALSWGKQGKDLQEFVLQTVSFDRNTILIETETGDSNSISLEQRGRQIQLGFQYSYNFHLPILKSSEKWDFYLGAGISPNVLFGKSTRSDTRSYNSTNTSIGMQIEAIPRVQYMVKERFFFDLSCPFRFANWNWSYRSTTDPTLSLNDREVGDSNFDGFPSIYQLKIGFGVRL